MITSVFIILLMLLLSAFFSGMEIAFTSKNRLKLEIDRKQSRLFNFIADIFGVEESARQERIRKYADLFELTTDLAQPVAAYSHGMKQKLAIIAALTPKISAIKSRYWMPVI